ncbi:MAG: hypothetical protein WC460_01865 [Patescibacteria group bacterium]
MLNPKGENLGGIIYKTPKELHSLNFEQRLRVLRARAEKAKEIADENLMAFARRARNTFALPMRL